MDSEKEQKVAEAFTSVNDQGTNPVMLDVTEKCNWCKARYINGECPNKCFMAFKTIYSLDYKSDWTLRPWYQIEIDFEVAKDIGYDGCRRSQFNMYYFGRSGSSSYPTDKMGENPSVRMEVEYNTQLGKPKWQGYVMASFREWFGQLTVKEQIVGIDLAACSICGRLTDHVCGSCGQVLSPNEYKYNIGHICDECLNPNGEY
jgi:hypothetical protein